MQTKGRSFANQELAEFMKYYMDTYEKPYKETQRIEDDGTDLMFFEGIHTDEYGEKQEIRGWIVNHSNMPDPLDREITIDLMNEGKKLVNESWTA